MRLRMLIGGLTLALAWGMTVPAGAESATVDSGDVHTFGVAPTADTVTGWFTIDRSASGVDVALETSGLTPGHAYTIWLGAWNAPEHCSANDGGEKAFDERFECNMVDDGPNNPLAGFSMMHLDGAVVTSDTHTFSGHRAAGDPDRVVVGLGLTDPQRAEIHLIVRDHGPARHLDGVDDADNPLIVDQTTTANGNCRRVNEPPPAPAAPGIPGTYECGDTHLTGP